MIVNSEICGILQRRRNEPLVEGYYIKWRAIPATSSSSASQNQVGLSSSDSHWLNVSKPNIDSYVVNNLRPFTNYEFFVIPYHKTVQGMPSNSMDGATSEARKLVFLWSGGPIIK